MKTKSILVVDDEIDIQALMQCALAPAELKIYSALDATQATMIARRVQPDLVILDINMPGGGGKLVYDRLRKMAPFASTPILIYSGIGRDQAKAQIGGHPKTLFLDKPARSEHILATVECMLEPAYS